MAKKQPKTYDDAHIAAKIHEVAAMHGGRMPSARELRAHGLNYIACIASRRYKDGLRGWAERLGLRMKPSETLAGQDVEARASDHLVSLGLGVARQTCKAPFDLLVNGLCRVDVKSAHRTAAGFVFGLYHAAIATLPKTMGSDVFMLCCMDAQDNFERIYYVPSHLLRRRMLSLGSKNEALFSQYLNDHGVIARLLERAHQTAEAHFAP
jgi:hypothetical protein